MTRGRARGTREFGSEVAHRKCTQGEMIGKMGTEIRWGDDSEAGEESWRGVGDEDGRRWEEMGEALADILRECRIGILGVAVADRGREGNRRGRR